MAKDKEHQNQEVLSLPMLLGQVVTQVVLDRTALPVARKAIEVWYHGARVESSNKQQFRLDVMKQAETMKLMSEDIYSLLIQVSMGDV